MKKRHPGAVTLISPEEFTSDRHSMDNSNWNPSEPWMMPNILGVANSNTIPCFQCYNEVAMMFEDKDGEIYWYHSGEYDNYYFMLERLGFTAKEIDYLLYIQLAFKQNSW